MFGATPWISISGCWLTDRAAAWVVWAESRTAR